MNIEVKSWSVGVRARKNVEDHQLILSSFFWFSGRAFEVVNFTEHWPRRPEESGFDNLMQLRIQAWLDLRKIVCFISSFHSVFFSFFPFSFCPFTFQLYPRIFTMHCANFKILAGQFTYKWTLSYSFLDVIIFCKNDKLPKIITLVYFRAGNSLLLESCSGLLNVILTQFSSSERG